MAAKNLKRNSKFNQKREVSVGVFELGYADITGDGSIVATFAANSVITKVVVIETAAVNTGATFDLLAGTTVVVNEGALDANNSATVAVVDLDIAKDITIRAGVTAPSQGSVKIIVEYIEYTMTNGEYTQS
ncbi:MAG: hypothetical protein ACRCXT_12375 [Paraclostridium sp.]|mgnify:FL=1